MYLWEIIMYNLNKIKAEIESLPQFQNQLLLQSDQKDLDLRTPDRSIVGNIVKDTRKNLDNKLAEEVQDIYFTYPIFDIPYINSIMEELNLSKTRLMVLEQRECYSWHRDFYPRVHIPIITDPEKCFMVVQSKFDPNDNGEIIRMPADGNYYFVDTTKHHTAINGSGTVKRRLHIVGSTTEIPPRYK